MTPSATTTDITQPSTSTADSGTAPGVHNDVRHGRGKVERLKARWGSFTKR
jgi:hypothetical protein